MTASVGGASMPADAATLTDLLRIADRALYTREVDGPQPRADRRARGRGRPRRAGRARQRPELRAEPRRLRRRELRQRRSRPRRRSTWPASSPTSSASTRAAALARLRRRAAARHRQARRAAGDPGHARPARHDRVGRCVRRHPDAGAEMLRLAPGLQDIAEVVRQHHERHDGAGYPERLTGRPSRRGPRRGRLRRVGGDALRSTAPPRALRPRPWPSCAAGRAPSSTRGLSMPSSSCSPGARPSRFTADARRTRSSSGGELAERDN